MSPITYNDAYEQTNPDATDEQRKQAALAIVAGTAANDAYWNSRSELEALRAQAEGHGVVERESVQSGTVESDPPTGSVDPTESGGVIEGTSTDASTETPASSGALSAPDNPTEAVAKLRAQLQREGINPEA